ncbi:hypothetical protein GTV32_09815 [Gordonia sp. SID5947]|uniref:ESX secretion-associated protein EspG n=1 Tax=Gordonia sp. SID5947 TaxID=2690315 RepID=UPI0013722CEC|nr:ESX secretion-associated protein EspG [Gordonia sp. SID5947]MYR06588.1 hypothetical protein [Gordonia sp. SID5947]
MTSENGLRPIGRVDSLTVRLFCRAYGLDTMPYPFITHIDAQDGDEVERKERETLESLHTEPPVHLTRWVQSSMHPDISAQLYGVFVKDGKATTKIRINAVRQGDDGFVAIQKSNPTKATDIVIYETDATQLGSAMLSFTPEQPAGRLKEVVIEKPTGTEDRRTGSLLSRNEVGTSDPATEFQQLDTEFSAFVQVNPFRLTDYGYDKRWFHVLWEHKAGDGQYLVTKDVGTRAIAADRQLLGREVDNCIARAVQAVRERRAAAQTDS